MERYWSANFTEDKEKSTCSEESLIDEFISLMRKAVEKRLMSDVPVGFFLSGGIDSSFSAALAAEISGALLKPLL